MHASSELSSGAAKKVELKVHASKVSSWPGHHVSHWISMPVGAPGRQGDKPNLGDQVFFPDHHRGYPSGIGSSTSGVLLLGVKFYISSSFVTVGKLPSITPNIRNSQLRSWD